MNKCSSCKCASNELFHPICSTKQHPVLSPKLSFRYKQKTSDSGHVWTLRVTIVHALEFTQRNFRSDVVCAVLIIRPISCGGDVYVVLANSNLDLFGLESNREK